MSNMVLIFIPTSPWSQNKKQTNQVLQHFSAQFKPVVLLQLLSKRIIYNCYYVIQHLFPVTLNTRPYSQVKERNVLAAVGPDGDGMRKTGADLHQIGMSARNAAGPPRSGWKQKDLCLIHQEQTSFWEQRWTFLNMSEDWGVGPSR